MTPEPDARSVVLDRIRAALGPVPAQVDVPRGYRTVSPLPGDSPKLLDLLIDRLVDYRALVRRAPGPDGDPTGVPAAIRSALTRHGAAAGGGPDRPTVVVPPRLPESWLQAIVDAGCRPVPDDHDNPLSVAALDAASAVLTAATVSIAETGTIVLDGSGDQGRRAISLVPDHHVCVVRADQVVYGVPEAMTRLTPDRPQTWISGPSATSDIELARVEGVHGPRTLEVVVAG